MLHALFYVSKSTLEIPAQSASVDAIIAVARSRNSSLDVTGALVFTHTHFAQLLEGPEAAVRELMESIRTDPRHCAVDIILDGPAAERRFGNWSMAYAGPSIFVKRRIEPLLGDAAEALSPAARTQSARSLIRLMSEFVAQAGGHG